LTGAKGVPLVLPHGPDGTHAGDRPDGCPRLLQAAGFEPEEAVSLNSFGTARASPESFAGGKLSLSSQCSPVSRTQAKLITRNRTPLPNILTNAKRLSARGSPWSIYDAPPALVEHW